MTITNHRTKTDLSYFSERYAVLSKEVATEVISVSGTKMKYKRYDREERSPTSIVSRQDATTDAVSHPKTDFQRPNRLKDRSIIYHN